MQKKKNNCSKVSSEMKGKFSIILKTMQCSEKILTNATQWVNMKRQKNDGKLQDRGYFHNITEPW